MFQVCHIRNTVIKSFFWANAANQARCKASRELAGWGTDFMIIVSSAF